MKKKPSIKNFQTSRPTKRSSLTLNQVKQRIHQAYDQGAWDAWATQAVVRQ